LGNTRELDEVSSTKYLSHIHLANSLCYTKPSCYELKSLELDKRTNSYIGVNTKELDRELFTK